MPIILFHNTFTVPWLRVASIIPLVKDAKAQDNKTTNPSDHKPKAQNKGTPTADCKSPWGSFDLFCFQPPSIVVLGAHASIFFAFVNNEKRQGAWPPTGPVEWLYFPATLLLYFGNQNSTDLLVARPSRFATKVWQA